MVDKNPKINSIQKERMLTGKKNLQKLLDEIAPFIKPKKSRNACRTGEWKCGCLDY